MLLSSLFQIILGFTGLVGVLLRFIGPLAIAPTITLVGVALFRTGAEKAGKLTVEYDYCCSTLGSCLFIFSFYSCRSSLGNINDVSSR